MSSPALDYHFIALNTADILRALHTNHIVCVYLMQQNGKNKENWAKNIKNAWKLSDFVGKWVA